jgi:DNA-binding CsgD family transcriptional regulator
VEQPKPGSAASWLARGDTTILDLVPWPIVIIDASLRILSINAIARLRLGQESVVGRELGALLSLEEAEEIHAHAKRWVDGETYPIRLVWPRRTGTLNFLITPVRLGQPPHAVYLLSFQPAAPIVAALSGEPALSAEFARAWGAAIKDAETQRAAFGPQYLGREGDAGLMRLTDREWEVAQRVATGDRVALLAEDLGISPNTVRNHLKAIFRKLDVRSQAALVRRLRQRQ